MPAEKERDVSKPYYQDDSCTIHHGDCLEILPTLEPQSINCCVTSPPYWGLRDYGVEGQLGLESTPEEYVEKLVEVFREVKRVLRDDGTLWLNLGDSYASNQSNNGDYSEKSTLAGFTNPNTKGRQAQEKSNPKRLNHGLKTKDLVGIPWRVAFALQADGWYLRQDIIWHKPNPMPESVKDRCTKAHEYIFLFTKSPKYYYDMDAIREDSVTPADGRGSTEKRKADGHPTRYGMANRDAERTWSMPSLAPNPKGRNKRSVWTVTTKPFKGAHFATFPPDLIEPCILAGCPKGGIVLDPFGGAGTTALVAQRNGRKAIACELNPEYSEIAAERLQREYIQF
jgi:DNA modification methylase